jgi:hypothetical protein
LDYNPLLAFHSEGSSTQEAHAPGFVRQWLYSGSKLWTLFDAFVGVAAAVGLGVALQQSSQSSSRQSVGDIPSRVPAIWLESHPVATSFEPLRQGVPANATVDAVEAINFDRCEIDVQGAHAVASCQGSTRWLFAGATPYAATHRWRLSLRKVNNAWQIHEVESR